MQRKVSAVQFMPLSVALQPPLSKSGLGYLCCFAVVSLSPHVTSKPSYFGKFKGFFFSIGILFVGPGIINSW